MNFYLNNKSLLAFRPDFEYDQKAWNDATDAPRELQPSQLVLMRSDDFSRKCEDTLRRQPVVKDSLF